MPFPTPINMERIGSDFTTKQFSSWYEIAMIRNVLQRMSVQQETTINHCGTQFRSGDGVMQHNIKTTNGRTYSRHIRYDCHNSQTTSVQFHSIGVQQEINFEISEAGAVTRLSHDTILSCRVSILIIDRLDPSPFFSF